MTNATYTLGSAPTIAIERCSGDLVVVGQAGETVTVAADSMAQSTQDGARLAIESCDDDLRLTVPHDATVIVAHVDGDMRAERLAALQLEGVDGDLTVSRIARSCAVRRLEGDLRGTDLGELAASTVEGDVHLERVTGTTSLGRVDGDVSLSEVADVSLGSVAGDLRLERAQGRLALERVDGDATVRGAVGGFGPARIGGDLTLETTFVPAQQYRLAVDGDATVAIPDDADLTLDATVDGDVSGAGEQRRDGAVKATWGDGSATLALTVGGDLRVRRAPASAASPRRETPAPAGARRNGVGVELLAERKPAPAPSQAATGDPMLDVLEALARGEISPAEAEDLLSRR